MWISTASVGLAGTTHRRLNDRGPASMSLMTYTGTGERCHLTREREDNTDWQTIQCGGDTAGGAGATIHAETPDPCPAASQSPKSLVRITPLPTGRCQEAGGEAPRLPLSTRPHRDP